MARQQDTCWRCGARWADEEASPAPLTLVAGDAGAARARADADRWADEGGSSVRDATA